VFMLRVVAMEMCFQSSVKWAVTALSRQMLRIRKGNLLSIRGAHAFVVISDDAEQSTMSCLEEDIHIFAKRPDEWRGERQISPGMTISMRELDGDGRLDFLIAGDDVIHTQFCFLSRNVKEIKGDKSQIVNSVSCVVAEAKVEVDEVVNTVDAKCTDDVEVGGICVYFCSLGQDLSRRRLKILGNEASLRGATVALHYLEATHIVISRQVESLEAVANYLGESKEVLEHHLNTVSPMKLFVALVL
jgi:hypothetical protein